MNFLRLWLETPGPTVGLPIKRRLVPLLIYQFAVPVDGMAALLHREMVNNNDHATNTVINVDRVLVWTSALTMRQYTAGL